MNIQERLQLLQDGEVISKRAATITSRAAERISTVDSDDLLNMLVTHLATALTRIERGEELEKPPTELVREVESISNVNQTNEELRWIEKEAGFSLPEEEIIFLKIHYATIFQQIGGEEK